MPTPAPTSTPRPLVVDRLVLVDAADDTVLGPLADGAVVDFSTLGARQLNFLADVSGEDAGRAGVLFAPGRDVRVEKGAPLRAHGGDLDGDHRAWTPSFGTPELLATPFADGDAGASRAISFTVRE